MKKVIITQHICTFDADANVANLSVCTKPDGYKTLIYTSGVNKSKLYCRILLEVSASLEVDHINGDTLDNRRNNLRIVTSQQNKFNTLQKNKKSGLPKGVTKHGPSYRAAIWWNYQRYYLGTFPTIELAKQAYLRAAQSFQGNYAAHLSRDKVA